MGYPKPLAVEKILRQQRPDLLDQVTAIHERFVAFMIQFYETTPDLAPKPGAVETFAALRAAGIRVALDTGFSRPIVDTILHRLGWTVPETLDCTVASDEVAQGRPYPDMIWRAMQLTGISDPQQVAKVGDTASDVQQGLAAHCRYVIGVTTGVFSEADLRAEQPTHVIAELPELLPLVLA